MLRAAAALAPGCDTIVAVIHKALARPLVVLLAVAAEVVVDLNRVRAPRLLAWAPWLHALSPMQQTYQPSRKKAE